MSEWICAYLLIREHQDGCFDKPLHRLNEASRIMTVDDAMVKTDRKVHKFSRLDLSINDHQALNYLVWTDDGYLWAVDHRRRRYAAERTKRGDGQRTT